MKNIFKIIGIIVLSCVVTAIVEYLVIWNIPMDLSIPTQIIIREALGIVFLIIFFSLLWNLFLKEKNISTSFLGQIKFKRTYFIIITIFILFSLISLTSNIDQYKKSYSLDGTSHFIGDSMYENSKYHFRLIYPKGSFFANAHPEHGFVTRFFLPDSESIGKDEENVGIYIKETNNDAEREVEQIKNRFSKYGPVDIKEVRFGGQKGYRIICVTEYSAKKGTKELFYITVKNGVLYQLNYFPVAKNISVVDTIASTFEFTQ